jgi:UDP-N-acetylglucosamine 2-epimerase (non-hydrolysing)
MIQITLVAGARPNFVKIAPIIRAIVKAAVEGYHIAYQLVHTGQHFDRNMSERFFEQLGIPEPDVNLECGGGTQAEQTANIMVRFEKYLVENPCDIVLVVGDVTSTMACSIVAKKLRTKVAHEVSVPVIGLCRKKSTALSQTVSRIIFLRPPKLPMKTCANKG